MAGWTNSAGSPWPFGVQWLEADDAFNFSLYSRHATGVTLLCYTEEDPATPVFEFRFQHPAHKTGNVWHCRIPASELHGATLYAYRVEGPHEPETGTASIRRRSCSILTRRRCFFHLSSAAKRALERAVPTDARRWAVCRANDRGPSDRAGPATHLPGRHRL